MAFFVLLERANVDQDSLRGLETVNQVLYLKEAEFDLRAIVEALELPPSAREELLVREGLDLFDVAIHVEQEVASDEALWALFHHVESVFDQLFDADETGDVVDDLQGCVEVHFYEPVTQLLQDGRRNEEKELYFLGEQVGPELHHLRYWQRMRKQ